MTLVDAVIAWHHDLPEDSAGCALCRKRREERERLQAFIDTTRNGTERP